MIRKAAKKELPNIKLLTEACAEAMINKGIFQWNQHYPSLERLREDIRKDELYVLLTGQKIVGIIVITPDKDKEYEHVDWRSKTENSLYIHRLATHPDHWGKGYARKLMDFAETYARTHNFESVRLDTFSRNSRNQRFYEDRGYQRLGNIYFPKQSEHPFYCYELLF
ncbi:GNAT family N-acetyltransferase [Christiangramia sabulilitoris]|uniref:GNAT family N-acetyltransferase n=1 Tax=Christiangramia sabulilitoris TaxID=2583991 RepID=A0A550I8Z1_9FLAO|nr:GNAT family N-acetyltransferase [Christiangramia sabulilitoris]TRO67440.1 GNAT family N-acetyltransferase [Christiangramia sabulilitoris]